MQKCFNSCFSSPRWLLWFWLLFSDCFQVSAPLSDWVKSELVHSWCRRAFAAANVRQSCCPTSAFGRADIAALNSLFRFLPVSLARTRSPYVRRRPPRGTRRGTRAAAMNKAGISPTRAPGQPRRSVRGDHPTELGAAPPEGRLARSGGTGAPAAARLRPAAPAGGAAEPPLRRGARMEPRKHRPPRTCHHGIARRPPGPALPHRLLQRLPPAAQVSGPARPAPPPRDAGRGHSRGAAAAARLPPAPGRRCPPSAAERRCGAVRAPFAEPARGGRCCCPALPRSSRSGPFSAASSGQSWFRTPALGWAERERKFRF